MLIIVIGLIILLWAWYKSSNYRKANNWLNVTGKLIEIEQATKVEPEVYNFRTYVFPVVKYEYLVNGELYEGNKVTFDKRNVFKEKVSYPTYERTMPWDSWREGVELDVFYNPKYPSESVLIRVLLPYRKSHYIALTVAGFLLVIIGVILESVNT